MVLHAHPDVYQALKDRVDIDFAFTSKDQYAAAEPVALDVYVKNVTDLIVKVYEINALNYYRTNGRLVDLNMDLDGLVANEEQTVKYTDPPLGRCQAALRLQVAEQCAACTSWSSSATARAAARSSRKGSCGRWCGRRGGQVFTILDEADKRVTDAAVWLAGHEYAPDKDGLIAVPFTHSAGPQPIILCQGDFATLGVLPAPAGAVPPAGGLLRRSREPAQASEGHARAAADVAGQRPPGAGLAA